MLSLRLSINEIIEKDSIKSLKKLKCYNRKYCKRKNGERGIEKKKT